MFHQLIGGVKVAQNVGTFSRLFAGEIREMQVGVTFFSDLNASISHKTGAKKRRTRKYFE